MQDLIVSVWCWESMEASVCRLQKDKRSKSSTLISTWDAAMRVLAFTLVVFDAVLCE